MSIVMYDLVGREDRRFSAHCWRIRMALAYKQFEHEARPTRFTEIAQIEDRRVKAVPARVISPSGARGGRSAAGVARALPRPDGLLGRAVPAA